MAYDSGPESPTRLSKQIASNRTEFGSCVKTQRAERSFASTPDTLNRRTKSLASVFQLLADGKKLPLALARFFAWGVGTGLGEIRGTLPVARRQKFLGFGRLSLRPQMRKCPLCRESDTRPPNRLPLWPRCSPAG
jgi:hypothetical protein